MYTCFMENFGCSIVRCSRYLKFRFSVVRSLSFVDILQKFSCIVVRTLMIFIIRIRV